MKTSKSFLLTIMLIPPVSLNTKEFVQTKQVTFKTVVKRKAYVVILLVLFATKFSAKAQEQDLNDGYAKYAKYLGAITRQQGAKVIFYMTAPDFQNEKPVAEPMKQADYEKKLGVILRLAQEFQPFAVIPVPMAINMIQQGGTEQTFRYVKDGPPNQRTAFLTANMFYAAFFNESTEGFKFNTVTENNPKGMEKGKSKNLFQRFQFTNKRHFY